MDTKKEVFSFESIFTPDVELDNQTIKNLSDKDILEFIEKDIHESAINKIKNIQNILESNADPVVLEQDKEDILYKFLVFNNALKTRIIKSININIDSIIKDTKKLRHVFNNINFESVDKTIHVDQWFLPVLQKDIPVSREVITEELANIFKNYYTNGNKAVVNAIAGNNSNFINSCLSRILNEEKPIDSKTFFMKCHELFAPKKSAYAATSQLSFEQVEKHIEEEIKLLLSYKEDTIRSYKKVIAFFEKYRSKTLVMDQSTIDKKHEEILLNSIKQVFIYHYLAIRRRAMSLQEAIKLNMMIATRLYEDTKDVLATESSSLRDAVRTVFSYSMVDGKEFAENIIYDDLDKAFTLNKLIVDCAINEAMIINAQKNETGIKLKYNTIEELHEATLEKAKTAFIEKSKNFIKALADKAKVWLEKYIENYLNGGILKYRELIEKNKFTVKEGTQLKPITDYAEAIKRLNNGINLNIDYNKLQGKSKEEILETITGGTIKPVKDKSLSESINMYFKADNGEGPKERDEAYYEANKGTFLEFVSNVNKIKNVFATFEKLATNANVAAMQAANAIKESSSLVLEAEPNGGDASKPSSSTNTSQPANNAQNQKPVQGVPEEDKAKQGGSEKSKNLKAINDASSVVNQIISAQYHCTETILSDLYQAFRADIKYWLSVAKNQ